MKLRVSWLPEECDIWVWSVSLGDIGKVDIVLQGEVDMEDVKWFEYTTYMLKHIMPLRFKSSMLKPSAIYNCGDRCELEMVGWWYFLEFVEIDQNALVIEILFLHQQSCVILQGGLYLVRTYPNHVTSRCFGCILLGTP